MAPPVLLPFWSMIARDTLGSTGAAARLATTTLLPSAAAKRLTCGGAALIAWASAVAMPASVLEASMVML